MRILFICHRWPYPPTDGARIRSFNIIAHLALEHEVVVASMTRSAEESREGKGLAGHCAATIEAAVNPLASAVRMLLRLPSRTPSSMGYFYSPDLAAKVRQALAEQPFDLIFVYSSSVAQYVASVNDVPKILDFVDMDSQKWLTYAKHKPLPLSLGYLIEGRKLESEERRLAQRFDLCTCATALERSTLEAFGTGTATDWFVNGVDHEYFAPGNGYDPGLISFIGRMDYFPNEQCMVGFCRDVLPRIQERIPEARLVIVGANPTRDVQALGRLKGVEVTGSVDDVRPYVQKSAVNVAPLTIARGTQNKILEAMAMGVPVVASRLAARGIDASAPEHLLVADDPGELADAVCSIMTDPPERERLSRSGRERMLTHHDWSRSMQRLDRILERCVSGRS